VRRKTELPNRWPDHYRHIVTAAVFTVDRTLLNGSVDEVIGRHLRDAGLLQGPAEAAPYRSAPEAWRSGPRVSAAARRAEGWSVKAVSGVAEGVADELVGRLHPYLGPLLEEHRAAGHRLVLASQTAQPLVVSFAARLGIEDVVGPVWEMRDHAYTGGLDDAHPWGRGKLVALRSWARGAAVSLRAAHAYAGSSSDANVLAAVQRPVAVNPDPVLAALARMEGWPIRHLDVPPQVIKIAGRELQEWFRPLQHPAFIPNAHFDLKGTDRIPSKGPVILVFNHRSYFDPTAMALLVARAGRTARFLGKKQVFDVPIIGRIGLALGGIRVDRSSGSDEPLDAATAALAGGELVCMAPQGTIPRGPAFFETELKGRWGAARLAARTGAPVIPVGLWGTELVWPRSSRLPSLSWPPPTITVTVGPPVTLGLADPDADTRAIMAAIVGLLPPAARQKRTPTDEELRRTFPPGYRGDASRESDRRPGTDT
jgi:putative phosphoserine phosphatase/1-acylglycerol-3-phosphate O-acyltransferase